jgi:hypothetical protein
MSNWKHRLTEKLEPILREPDPRPKISAYHDMPFAIFVYPPTAEFAVREQVALLRTRLRQRGKEVTTISLAQCLNTALEAEGLGDEGLGAAERESGLEAAIDTAHEVLNKYQPLDSLVARQVPQGADPKRDIVFLTRAGALFPVYRTSSLLEQLKGKISVPTVLFYPGTTDGPAGLRFMGVLDAEHNYRPKIF